MQSQGVDISGPEFADAEFETAVVEIEKRIAEGYIRRIKGNSYLEDLKSGDAIAGIVWSGDLFVLRAETGNDNWQFVIPESGGTLWSDNMMVPITSPHRQNAQTLMNYYYDPDVAAQVAAWVNYYPPVVGTQDELAKIDPDWPRTRSSSPATSTSRATTSRASGPQPAEDAKYSAAWQKVRATDGRFQ